MSKIVSESARVTPGPVKSVVTKVTLDDGREGLGKRMTGGFFGSSDPSREDYHVSKTRAQQDALSKPLRKK